MRKTDNLDNRCRLQWLQAIIDKRIYNFLNPDNSDLTIDTEPPALETSEAGVFYADFVRKYGLTPMERKLAECRRPTYTKDLIGGDSIG